MVAAIVTALGCIAIIYLGSSSWGGRDETILSFVEMAALAVGALIATVAAYLLGRLLSRGGG